MHTRQESQKSCVPRTTVRLPLVSISEGSTHCPSLSICEPCARVGAQVSCSGPTACDCAGRSRCGERGHVGTQVMSYCHMCVLSITRSATERMCA